MKRLLNRWTFLAAVVAAALTLTAIAAPYWTSFENDTRYLALGDSLSAGYGAHPATNGFVYRLYQSGAIDDVNNTLLCNIGVPNAMSGHVLDYQVPQAGLFFSQTGSEYRKVITLTVGGNDLVQILGGADPQEVLGTFGANLASILGTLSVAFPDAEIYVANQYDPLIPGGRELILGMNQVIDFVVSAFSQAEVVDVFGAFDGRNGLLLIEKTGSAPLQVHPTNAGYRVMADAFIDAVR